MNSMTKSVLTLASYDDKVSDNSLENVLRQCLSLIATFPKMAVYAYHAYNHYERDDSLYIHRPDPSLSTAENILRLLRPDKSYSALEANVLDLALASSHGAWRRQQLYLYHPRCYFLRIGYLFGYRSEFSLLKGPKHGGANIKVVEMMADIKEHVTDTTDPGSSSCISGKDSPQRSVRQKRTD